MASTRLWSPSKSQNRARTEKIKSNRQKSEQLNLPLKDNQLSKRESIFSKDSVDESEPKSSYQEPLIQSSNKSKIQSSNRMPILQSYKDSLSYKDSGIQSQSYKDSGIHSYKESGSQSQKDSGISKAITKKQQQSYKHETEHEYDDEIEENKQTSAPLKKTRVMRDTAKEQKNIAVRKLEELRVQFKKIQEIQQEKYLQQQAKQFILRLRREKRQFDGKIYLLKKQEQEKRKAEVLDQMIQKAKQKQIKKIHRMRQIQKRLQNFKNKEQQREIQMTRQRAYSMNKSKLSKLKLSENRYQQKLQPKVESPTYRIGKKYLEQSGRIKKRVKTQSSHYYQLNDEQRRQLDKIRQKIDQLTKSIK